MIDHFGCPLVDRRFLDLEAMDAFASAKYVKWRIAAQAKTSDRVFRRALRGIMKTLTGRFIGLTAAMALLSGCGEVAYKTGAGADTLQADQRICKQAGGGGPDDYKSCMNAKGWSIADLNAGPSSNYAPPKTEIGVASSAGPAPSVGSATSMGATPTLPASQMRPVTDPMTPIPVTAWVKFGGGPPNDAIADCVATLGPGYAPDKLHKTVPVALLSCMRDHGWRAL